MTDTNKESKTWGDIVREYFPNATEVEVDIILWNRTCYPFGTIEMVREQLKLESNNPTQ